MIFHSYPPSINPEGLDLSSGYLVRDLLESVGMFYAYEIDLALEQFRTQLTELAARPPILKGLFSDTRQLLAYLNLTNDPSSDGYWRLNWLVVTPAWQRKGLGAALLKYAEGEAHLNGGVAMLIETGGKQTYAQTRHFYEKHNYNIVGRIPAFFGKDDDKVIYVRMLDATDDTSTNADRELRSP